MTMTDDDHNDSKDPKVKDLVGRDPSQPLDQVVDAATAAQLERWFGLPSFAQVEAGEAVIDDGLDGLDPEVAAVRDRRKRIAAEIDKELLAAIERRHTPPDDLIKFAVTLEPRDTTIALVDPTYFEARAEVAEQREYERPEDVEDLLRENTPQALLRDLHRPEFEPGQSSNEIENWDEEQPPPEPLIMDVRGKIVEAMAMRFKLEPVVAPDVPRLTDEFRNEVRRSWVEIATSGKLYNRRVTE